MKQSKGGKLSKLPSLLEKIENTHSYCQFVKEERERRDLISSLNRSLESLTKNLCKYCFLKIVLDEISLSDLKRDMFIQKVDELNKYLERILVTTDKLKEEHEKCQESINQLNTEINQLINDLLINVTKKLDRLNSLLIEKKTILSNEVIAKMFDINLEIIDSAGNLIKDFQQRIRREISLDDITWINDEMPKFGKIIRNINEKASAELLREKMKLTKEEAEVVSKLVSGESVPLTKLSNSLLEKIKEFFADMAKITITS